MMQLEQVIRTLQTDTVYHTMTRIPDVGQIEYIHTKNLAVAPGGIVCISKNTFDNLMKTVETLRVATETYHKLAFKDDTFNPTPTTDKYSTSFSMQSGFPAPIRTINE